jgi:hypothetical protein
VLVDPADLIDGREFAALLGLDNPNGISVYRKRYADADPPFPAPLVEKGRCLLWHRPDAEAYARSRGRLS